MFSHGFFSAMFFLGLFGIFLGPFLNHLTSTAALRSPRGEDPPGYTAKTRPRICRAGPVGLRFFFFWVSEISCWKIIRWRRCFEKQQHCEATTIWPMVWLKMEPNSLAVHSRIISRTPFSGLFLWFFGGWTETKMGTEKIQEFGPGVWAIWQNLTIQCGAPQL